MSKKKTTVNVEVECYLVAARCNFDDVFIGTFTRNAAGLAAARKLAKRVAKNPDLRFGNTTQANDTEQLFVSIFQASKPGSFCEIWRFGEGGKAEPIAGRENASR